MNQQKGTISREILIDAIRKDSIGPREKEEEFINSERPQSRYFSGVLYPKRTPADEGDDIVEGDTETSSKEGEENDDSVSKNVLKFDTKPSSMGLTCYLLSGTKSIDVKVKYGIYHGTDDEKKEMDFLYEKLQIEKNSWFVGFFSRDSLFDSSYRFNMAKKFRNRNSNIDDFIPAKIIDE